MEENQKESKILEDCAEIAKKIEDNPYLKNSQITLKIPKDRFNVVLTEIEKFVRIKVDRTQTKISIDIGDTEFIFMVY
tara:strand:+ start:1383 stop:1616 length:234 start_codon:yes stop_codon:yes gene_type:complete